MRVRIAKPCGLRICREFTAGAPLGSWTYHEPICL